MAAASVEDFPLKIFIKDINNISSEGSLTTFRDIKYNKIETQGVITKIISHNSNIINFELSDLTGQIDVYYKNNNQNDDVEGIYKELLETVNEDKDGLKTLESMYNTMVEDPINKGDYVTVIGIAVLGTGYNTFSAYEFYKTSLISNYFWTEDVLDLYLNHYNN